MSFLKQLNTLKDAHQYRSMALPRGIDLSSNDYLGFRSHPALKQAALAAIEDGMALGAGASRLLRGHMPEHESLEEYAAAFFGHEKALYFSNGYQANVALFQTLPDRHDVIIFDALIHASARDGIQTSLAKHIRAAHNDVQAYEDAIKNARNNGAKNIWIAVESLYSMDGDFAPLDELYKLAQKYDAYLVVDEAHSTGVCGKNGTGLCSNFAHNEKLITLHTCGKALGSAGGLICASAEIISYIVNKARPFIYSTAPPPLQAHITEKALALCASDAGHTARTSLLNLINYVKLNTKEWALNSKEVVVQSQIIPVILGDAQKALDAAKMLQDAGYDIRAVRPPTVPKGTSRLRLSLNAGLTTEILDEVFNFIHNQIFS